MKKQTYYAVGNAHLDPVWQWRWQEGSAEAKATVRSALDRMKEFPDFKFVCSSASVYRWIEAFSPAMFEEIRERVKEGRFVIVGGFYVQPDCNLPSGEGFARQSLYSQRYFAEKFGVTAKVGYNVDSFGHNAMLPQILKKSGMDSYIFMRPGPHEKEMESDVFEWRAPDGSSVTAWRILDPYCFQFGREEELEARMRYLAEHTKTDLDFMPLFYGVGNHGGGPTIRHLELLHAYAQSHPETEIIYSDLSDFFGVVRQAQPDLPVYEGDLQHHASGCYAAVPHVKNGIRRGETALTAAESFGVLAEHLCGRRCRTERFEEAWNDICFLHFHDSMGGCSIKEVHEDARYQYGAALNTAAVEENNALQTVSWAIDTADMSKGLPVVVFNPHGFEAEQIVTLNKQCRKVVDAEGRDVPIQQAWSTTAECYWRRDTAFRAKVPALGYAVYYLQELCGDLNADEPTESPVRASLPDGWRTANNRDCAVLENEIYRIGFEMHTGYIVSMIDKRSGEEILAGRAAVPTVIDEYYHDTWSHGKNFFDDTMARMADAEVSVTENGPIRATVKVVSRYGTSVLTQYFTLEQGSERLSVRAHVDWHEKHKMLKLAWPMKVENPHAVYEIPFGEIARPADGEEEPGLMWTAVVNPEGYGYALLNDNTYSSSVKDGTIFHTVLRSPIYGDHGGPRTDESEFTAQGRFDFSYILMPITPNRASVVRAARLLNQPLTNIIETWHEGALKPLRYGALTIDAENVVLSACKPSEDGEGLVLRLYEIDGKDTDVTVSGDLLRVPLRASIGARSVCTFLLRRNAQDWEEVLLTELPTEEK